MRSNFVYSLVILFNEELALAEQTLLVLCFHCFITLHLLILQVTCEYCFSGGACVPLRVHTVVVSVQHSDKISLTELRQQVTKRVIHSVIPSKYLDSNTVIHVNPCGDFVMGGPQVIYF